MAPAAELVPADGANGRARAGLTAAAERRSAGGVGAWLRMSRQRHGHPAGDRISRPNWPESRPPHRCCAFGQFEVPPLHSHTKQSCRAGVAPGCASGAPAMPGEPHRSCAWPATDRKGTCRNHPQQDSVPVLPARGRRGGDSVTLSTGQSFPSNILRSYGRCHCIPALKSYLKHRRASSRRGCL